MDVEYVLMYIITVLLCTGVAVLCYLCFKRDLTRSSKKSTELLVFRRHYSELQCAIQSPEVSAGILYAEGIIDANVRDRALLNCITRVERNQILLNAVEQAIKTHHQHFHQFLEILADEPTTVPLYNRLQESYNTAKGSSSRDTADSDSFSPTQQTSNSKETQTVMPLPQRLRVSVPIHCATIKAVTDSSVEMISKDGDEWLTLTVSIVDSSSETPLRCIVALQGDERTPTNGQMICFLSISVSSVEDSQPQKKLATTKNLEPAYYCRRSRKSKYTPNGKVTLQLCFFQADANYIISMSIDSIQDEEGIECIGYAVEHYTGFISTVRTVERNAFKAPPLKKYEGPIASNKFHKLMGVYTQLFYEGKKVESDMIMSRITSSDSTKLDVKLYMSISKATEKGFDVQTITELEELFQKCQSLDSQNGFLLQALAMMCLSQSHSFQGRTEKALQCIHHSRSVCWEAAPSHLTSCVFFNDARILVSMHKENMSQSTKRRILELLDRAIADSYYGRGWERLMIFNTHVYKALFCLNGVFDLNVGSTPQYTPTEEDISLAEQHLNAVPVEELVSKIHMHKVLYHTALSDLNRWKENTESAREHAEAAKQLCVEKKYFTNLIPSLNARLQWLEPDAIDEILKEYEDHVQ